MPFAPTRVSGRDQSDRGAHKMIALRNLEKSIKTGAGETFLLRRINFDVKPGEFISIMGPSGAGKSTLLHILGMHDTDWRGEYELHDQPIQSMRQKDRLALQKKHIGFVFQSYHLLDNLTVYENPKYPQLPRLAAVLSGKASCRTCSIGFRLLAKKDCIEPFVGWAQQLVGVARGRGEPSSLLRMTDRQPALRSGARNHGVVQEATTTKAPRSFNVTHSATNAQYGNRIIKLRDGWIVNVYGYASSRVLQGSARSSRR